jgi:hypothetical protein
MEMKHLPYGHIFLGFDMVNLVTDFQFKRREATLLIRLYRVVPLWGGTILLIIAVNH